MVSVKVYKYGLPFGPQSNRDVALRQMRLAHRYQNNLIQVELGRLRAVREIIASHESIAEIDRQISVEEDKKKLKALRAMRKTVQKQLHGDPRITEVNARALALSKALRATCGVYWGTYLLVEDAVKRARAAVMDPSFKRWTGEGRIGVQIQKGMSTDDVFGSDSRVSVSGEGRFRVLNLRVCSDGRDPVFASFPMVMHRPLPEGRIKRVDVQLRRVATREEWSVCFVVDSEAHHQHESKSGHVVAVDFGAKGESNDRRIALAVGTDGHVESFNLDKAIADRFSHADQIRSTRDHEFESAKSVLKSLILDDVDAPEWLKNAFRYAHAWRSPAKLDRIVRDWSRMRFDGDSAAFGIADAWRRQNRHLHQWEANERKKAERRRQDAFRVWAARLAKRYGRLVYENVNLSEPKKVQEGEIREKKRNINRVSNFASPGELRQSVVHAFAGRAEKLAVSKRWAQCPACRLHSVEHNGGDVACGSCGARMESDFARCWNILEDHGVSTKVVHDVWKSSSEFARAAQTKVRAS